MKRTRIGWPTTDAAAEFRAEFFNAFNRVRFSGPNGTFDNSAFGTVSSQGNGPRQIQLALKLIF